MLGFLKLCVFLLGVDREKKRRRKGTLVVFLLKMKLNTVKLIY